MRRPQEKKASESERRPLADLHGTSSSLRPWGEQAVRTLPTQLPQSHTHCPIDDAVYLGHRVYVHSASGLQERPGEGDGASQRSQAK